ncbi:Pr6Pr family membrane protein [Lysinibacter sp. HNR]|uniref:Pr6Pr family membrane protein n=1 Tax=Lysinibacter sp. HNR TaxID=3031408 RepID=UPI0024349B96|nr:Pr6Pr family membrane protein [Lysinibacter sp. HNR]WGD36519.1 Pr6Pr family membrane protein [Lysinibacter sp. HNR]
MTVVTKRRTVLIWALIRLLMSALIVAAVIGQLTVSINFWQKNPLSDIPFLLVGFFSFFTIESNIFSAIMLVVLAWLGYRNRAHPTWFSIIRVSIVTYMVITGLVYNLLLRGIPLPQGSTLGWSNEVFHVFACIYILVDWIWGPDPVRIAWRSLWWIISFPLVWVTYTLLRGSFSIDARTGEHWYPYPFLNPANFDNGYAGVAVYVVAIAAAIILVGSLMIWISHLRIALSTRGSVVAEPEIDRH